MTKKKGRIDKADIETLLATARLEEVAAQFLPDLSSSGKNRHAACPMCAATKKERKFSISVPKQMFKCFGCDGGGVGALGFLTKTQNKPYLQAIQWLADFYKMELRQEVVASIGTTAEGATFDTSYFDQRMAEMGYSAARNPDLFTAHSDGGIVIRYPRLEFAHGESPWQQHNGEVFWRKRRHPSRVTTTQKYEQPPDSGIHVFVPPSVAALHRSGNAFDTLYIVEGEFKAFVMAQAGVPCIGIGGIDMFMRKKGSKELHPDIMQLLSVGRCKTVVLIHDADAMTVKWNPDGDPEKDLAERPTTFAGAVTRFRLAVGPLVGCVLYAHVAEEFAESAKGIDDLAGLKGVQDVAHVLQQKRTSSFFKFADITADSYRAVNGLFALNIHKGVPGAFFRRHQDTIGERPFVFRGGTYQFELDDDANGGGNLVLIGHADSKKFIRVGCDHYKLLWNRNEYGKQVPYRKAWKDSYITSDYVKKGVANFFDTIPKFDDFIVVPGHFDDYQQVVTVNDSLLYNKYYQLDHEPVAGPYPHITGYLKHLLGEEEVQTLDDEGNVLASSPAWVVYLDRWTIMLRHPLEKVVAVVVGSPERNTGKSTLLQLNRALWQSNGAIIPNEAITDQFNSDWSDLKWVGIDETLIEKKKDQERLKSLITGFAASRRGMYQERTQSVNFISMDFTTNDLETFIQIAPDEFRYWVKHVPVLKKRDPELLGKMLKEVPHLIHDLRTRKIVHPKRDRLWFANSVIETEARKNVAKQSVGWCESEIRAWIAEQFDHYRWPELYFNVSQVHKALNTDNGAKFRRGEVSRVLDKVMKVPRTFDRLIVPKDPEWRTRERKLGEDAVKQRFYVFSAADFLPVDDALELLQQSRAEWATCTESIDEHSSAVRHPMPLLHPKKFPEPVLA